MMSCEYHESTIGSGDWVTLMLDTDNARPYLEKLREIAIEVSHDLMQADDANAAPTHFDFAVALIDTIHRINTKQKEKKA